MRLVYRQPLRKIPALVSFATLIIQLDNLAMPASQRKTWDIFCRVIDNFGDIGVCWRLARQLVDDHNQSVRLWVDDLNSLIRIWPEAKQADHQWVAGVEVRYWRADIEADVQVADVVIEAFACEIPAIYLNRMAMRKDQGQVPVWINLDYLSAEKWVEGCHCMPSTHPTTGLRKTFFFPGFTPKTGGLLRESSLADTAATFDAVPWLAEMGIEPAPGALLISLFAYENSAAASLLHAWEESTKPIHCLVPQGKILASINHALGLDLDVGSIYRQGILRLQVIPFLTQTVYDNLLWACDINFVRGEDSFVRAQWAGKPMFWHIYPQDDEAHLAKLEAFLALYLRDQPATFAAEVRQSWLNWNSGEDMSDGWQRLIDQHDKWRQHSREWRDFLLKQPDLATQLTAYCAAAACKKSTTENP